MLHGDLYSVTSNLSFGRYDCKLRVEYKVRCQPKEVAFYIMTHLKIQGKEDCQYNGRNVYVMMLFLCCICMTIV